MPNTTGQYGEEVVAMVLHELRNPLNVMCNALALCPATDGPPQALAVRQLFDRQLRRALRLLEDLLDVSRLNRDASVSDEEPIDLAELVGYEAAELQDRCGARHMVLTLDMPPAAVWVLGSRLRLSQVIGNLLDNSAKYSPIGGGILVQLRREAGTCMLRIRDGGVGIRSEDLPHIFDPFFRGTDPRRGRPDGLGLGLTLVKRLIELHRGSIEAQSEGEGRGSEFIVRLPLIES